MEKQTKIVLGLAAAGVVAYLVLKPKAEVVTQNTPTPATPTPANPTNPITPTPPPKTNADVLFPAPENFSWREYFFGIKPIWSRSWW